MRSEHFQFSVDMRSMFAEAGLSGNDQALLVGVLGIYVTTLLTGVVVACAALGIQGMNSSNR